jgi:hypothetical protein
MSEQEQVDPFIAYCLAEFERLRSLMATQGQYSPPPPVVTPHQEEPPK